MRMLMILLVVAAAQAGEFPAWMSGSWRLTTIDGTTVEEHWTTAAGGVMLGMNRTLDRAGKASFEFLRIERRDAGKLCARVEGIIDGKLQGEQWCWTRVRR